MAKRKRFKRRTTYGVIEGEKAETNLLTFLKEIYLDETLVSFKEDPNHGGNPNRLLDIALKNLFYDKIFVWIDEDMDLASETRESLAKYWVVKPDDLNDFFSCPLRDLQRIYNANKKNPILIVSQPVCVESLILRTLGNVSNYSAYEPEQRKERIKNLKSSLSGVIGKMDPLEFFRKRLNKELLEERRKEIPELDLLISMITV